MNNSLQLIQYNSTAIGRRLPARSAEPAASRLQYQAARALVRTVRRCAPARSLVSPTTSKGDGAGGWVRHDYMNELELGDVGSRARPIVVDDSP